MSSKNSSQILSYIVRCGLVNNFGIQQDFKDGFWPVAEAIATNASIDKTDFNKKFSLVFTSKTAVKFFYDDVFSKENISLENCIAVYCVGQKTKEYFEYLFNFSNLDCKIYFSEKMGIQNLMTECGLENKTHLILFFTALVGKTKDIIQKKYFNAPFKIYPIYKLQPYKSDFLKKLFFQREENHKIYRFECYSGLIFEYTVQFLMEFFKLKDIHHLPDFIKLVPVGASAIEKERQFYEE